MIRIACSAVTRRIKAGRVTKDGWSFIGEPKDVTTDVLKAVIEFIGIDHEQVIIVDGKPTYKITVTAIEEQT